MSQAQAITAIKARLAELKKVHVEVEKTLAKNEAEMADLVRVIEWSEGLHDKRTTFLVWKHTERGFQIAQVPAVIGDGPSPPPEAIGGICPVCEKAGWVLARHAMWGGVEFDTHFLDVFFLCSSCVTCTPVDRAAALYEDQPHTFVSANNLATFQITPPAASPV